MLLKKEKQDENDQTESYNFSSRLIYLMLGLITSCFSIISFSFFFFFNATNTIKTPKQWSCSFFTIRQMRTFTCSLL